MEWPCGICGKNVIEDGIKCVECEKWCHVEGYTDVVSPNDYISKPYSCKKCSEKSRGKAKKPKDSSKGKKGWQTKMKGEKPFYPKLPNKRGLDSK